jgi:very-short-patch-repair endonuclease
MLGFCERHGFAQPKTRVKLGPYEADFLFEEKGLFVETDGWRAHRGRVAFESDHERDLWMKVNGFEYVRLTWEQVTVKATETAAALRAILDRL